MNRKYPLSITLTTVFGALFLIWVMYYQHLYSGSSANYGLLVPFVILCAAMFGVWKARVMTHNFVVVPIQNKIAAKAAEEEKNYQNLPELGKARVDKRLAKGTLVGNGVLWVGLTTFASIISPIAGIIIGTRGIGKISDAWRQYNAEDAAANERRYKALGS